MRAIDCVLEARRAGSGYQRAVNQFVDDFRRASGEERRSMVQNPIERSGPLEGLVAGTVSALCREVGLETPDWVGHIGSPEPFFALTAESFEMRVRLMIESPVPFRIRRVFVPENYLSRA
jgi:hypothetical protein